MKTRVCLKYFVRDCRLQSDPIGKVVDLSKKTLSKEAFQLLNKNLNFVPTPKYIISTSSMNKWKYFTEQ